MNKKRQSFQRWKHLKHSERKILHPYIALFQKGAFLSFFYREKHIYAILYKQVRVQVRVQARVQNGYQIHNSAII